MSVTWEEPKIELSGRADLLAAAAHRETCRIAGYACSECAAAYELAMNALPELLRMQSDWHRLRTRVGYLEGELAWFAEHAYAQRDRKVAALAIGAEPQKLWNPEPHPSQQVE
jgi:hypothetical protein